MACEVFCSPKFFYQKSFSINFFWLKMDKSYFLEKSLHASVFGATYNLQSFNSRFHKYLKLRPNASNFFSFYSQCKGSLRTTELALFWCDIFLFRYHYKKKNGFAISLGTTANEVHSSLFLVSIKFSLFTLKMLLI